MGEGGQGQGEEEEFCLEEGKRRKESMGGSGLSSPTYSPLSLLPSPRPSLHPLLSYSSSSSSSHGVIPPFSLSLSAFSLINKVLIFMLFVHAKVCSTLSAVIV